MLDVNKTVAILKENYNYTDFAVKDETIINSIYGRMCACIKELPAETLTEIYAAETNVLAQDVKNDLLVLFRSNGLEIEPK